MPTGIYKRIKPSWNKGMKGFHTEGSFKKGHISWNKNRKLPQFSGEKNPFFGKHHTKEAKIKMKERAKGKHRSLATEFKKGNIPWNKGKKEIYPKETIEKMKKARIGKVPWNKGIPCPEETKRKIRKSEKGKYLGEKNWNWQGGKSFEPYTTDWTETLRRSIRERDNYICQLCSQYGNTVHHKDYNKLNCNPDNLITLCIRCNSKVNFYRDYWKNYFKNK